MFAIVHHMHSDQMAFVTLQLFQAWKPSISVTQILVGIQDLLDNPNPASAAQNECYKLYKKVLI